MGGKIKKFFLSFSRLNKPAVLAAVFFFIFLGLALPSQFIQAQGGILGALMAIPINIVSLLFQVLLAISIVFVGLAGLILSWVLSPYFMSLPYTYGGIVDIGWPIVRDFINMFFIIALVIIGLATALRIKEYQAQKALPILIIIAILINFTPVICGVIIDASNILMNFFLEEITGLKLMGNLFATQGAALSQALTHFFDIRYATNLLAKTISMIAFSWIAAFIFLLYSILFIMRYVMLWVLVIVSPMAFFSRIFPASQRYLFKSILGWDEWWKQFIEWSLLGVVVGFFLYLAEQLMVLAPTMIAPVTPDLAFGWISIPVVEFINNLLPYGVVLAFLLLSFFIATSTSAMGASAVTNFLRKKGAGIAKSVGRGVTTLAARGSLRYLGKPTEAIARRLEKVPTPWAREKGLKGVVSKTLAPGAALTRLAGTQLRRAPAALKERTASGVDKQEKELTGKSAETQAAGWNEAYQRAVTTEFGWEKAVGSLRAGIKGGNLSDIQTKLGLNNEEMTTRLKRTATEAAKYGKQKEILQSGLLKDNDIKDVIKGARLSEAEQDIYGLKLSEADKKKYEGSIYRKTMAEIKPGEISHFAKSVVTNKEGEYPEAQKEIQRWAGPQIGEAARTFGSPFVDSYMAEAKKREDEHPGWHMENAPKAVSYLRNVTARDLGFDPSVFKASPTGWTPPEGFRPPRGYTPGGPPPGWTPAMLMKKGWTWTAPPPPAATPPVSEEERLVEEWPKTEKGMPKDIKDTVKEGQKYIETLGEKIKSLEVLDESIEELKRDLTSLKEKTIKTPIDEELIRRMEVELLPAREEEGKLTQESISEIRSRLGELRESIKPWEEHKKEVEAGGKEEERVKEVYKRLKKEFKERRKPPKGGGPPPEAPPPSPLKRPPTPPPTPPPPPTEVTLRAARNAASSTNEPTYAIAKDGSRHRLQQLPIGRITPDGKEFTLEDGSYISISAVDRLESGGKILFKAPPRPPGGSRKPPPLKGPSAVTGAPPQPKAQPQAEEMLLKPPPPPPPTRETRKRIPKREYRRSKKQRKKRRGKEEEEEY